MKKYRIKIRGMSCSACEEHIVDALEKIGAKNIQASFRQGEAVFELPEDKVVDHVKMAIDEVNYQPGKIEEVSLQNTVDIDDEGDFDLLIIGSGSAAFSAAIKATEYGAKVGMIERGTVGGTCVNIGCVPSKTLLRASEINYLAKNNPFHRLHTSANEVDLTSLIEQKDELVSEMRSKKYVDLIAEYGIKFIKGDSSFINENQIVVNEKIYSANRFLIATGVSPSLPEIKGLADADYLTSTSLLDLKVIPKRLTVIGSGYIGLELGQLFHNLGSEVTLIQRSEQLLKEYDPEISDAVKNALIEQGITVINGAHYDRVEQVGEIKSVYITVNSEEMVLESEQLLVATGRKPNTETLNLDKADVKVGSHNEIMGLRNI